MPKNDKKKQVPTLRFEGFTDDWIKKKIKDIALVNSGRDYKHLRKGNIPVYGTGGFMTKVNKSLSKENAIGLGRKGTINKPQFLVAPFWTVDTLFYITVNKNITLSFFHGLTQTINWLRYDESSGVPSLSRKNINDVNVIIPELDEQIKIGKAIDMIDNLITLEQEKLEKFRTFKTQIIRMFYYQNWNISLTFEYKNLKSRLLKEILVEKNDKTIINNEYPILSSTTNGLFLQNEVFKKQVASKHNVGYKIIEKNEIVLSPQNLWLGNINFNNKYEIGMVSPSYKIFKIRDGYDKYLIGILLKLDEMKQKYESVSEQGASVVRRNLNINDFYHIELVLPDINTQQKISKTIKLIDNLVEKQQYQIQFYMKLKEKLLRNLFV